jgi:hypothetical protein
MTDTSVAQQAAAEAKMRLPWFVVVSPEFYDDAHDTGYGWEGWATNIDDAVAQALAQCHRDNDRDPENPEDDIDPENAKVHFAEIDFRRLAGALVHWARSMGGWQTPLWRAMEAAVLEADVTVAPLDPTEGR